MGCCQSTNDSAEVVLGNLQDKLDEVTKGFGEQERFDEISLESRAGEDQEEETTCLARYTENNKGKQVVSVGRPTSYSLHRTEIEQSFLMTKGNLFGKEQE